MSEFVPDFPVFVWIFIAVKVIFWGAIIYLLVRFLKGRTFHTRKCPFCAEIIRAEAAICRHCGKDMPEFSPSEKENE